MEERLNEGVVMKKKQYRRKRIDGVQAFSGIMILLLTLIIFIPFWNAVVSSFNTVTGVSRHPFSLFPAEFTLANYEKLFDKMEVLLAAYKNTIILTVFGTVIGMIVSIMAAYGFSRQFPGKKLFFRLMMFTMFFGGGLVPTYLQFKNMGLLNTFAACILIGLASTYNIIIMKNGFESVPMDLQEAAMIDGANDFTILLKVMLPLQKPLIATFSLFTMVDYWNSWYWPMILFGGGNKTVLQLFLRGIVNNVTVEDNMQVGIGAEELIYTDGIKMAAVMLVMLPIMLVYPFVQKYFTKGIMVGAVKM